MGNKGPGLKEFCQKENEISAFTNTARALGVAEVDDTRDEVEIVLDDDLSAVQGINEETRITLKEVLTADLRPYLRDPRSQISMLDAKTLGLTEVSEVKKFLYTHNIDMDNRHHLKYLEKIFTEAVEFYDKYIRNPKQRKIPDELKDFSTTEGIITVFKTASGEGNRHHISKACALLRIAAVIDYIESDPFLSLIDEAFSELDKILKRNFKKSTEMEINHDHGNGNKRGNKDWYYVPTRSTMVPMRLMGYELRKKSREQIIAKLFHKPENRTDNVLDRTGSRIYTYNAAEAMKLFYHLFFNPDTAIFPGFNIRVSQTKNLGINQEFLRMALADPREAENLFSDLSVKVDDRELLEDRGSNYENKFSSPSYRALHVIFDFPFWTKDRRRVSFPVELQIVDLQAKVTNERRASHTEYKNRQRKEVRTRVTGNNLQTAYELEKKQK
ncbi:TIGR04552 family protein [Candidatus Peregrinibacteria bacterium]|nr:TIGR04552 family protein [Candidatus Peregrinibacteria bacterium]